MKYPDDIREAAEAAWSAMPVSHIELMRNPIVTIVARAILAERERCERIAKRVWRDADFYENNTVRRAASLIRCRIETGAPQ